MGVFKRSATKLYKRGKKAVKKRYGLNKKSTGMNAGTMIRDGMTVANMARRAYQAINAELKTIVQPTITLEVGQVNANLTGTAIFDISPYQVGQNLTANGRQGNSIKIKSTYFQIQFQQQAAAAVSSRIIMEIWAVKGVPDTGGFGAVTLPRLFDAATFSGVIDAFSPRNQNAYNDYVCIRRKRITIPYDSVTGLNQLKTVMFGHSWNKGQGHHIRYQGDTNNSTDIANGQILITLRSDTGNKSINTASTLPVFQPNFNTGVAFKYTHKHYYYDN